MSTRKPERVATRAEYTFETTTGGASRPVRVAIERGGRQWLMWVVDRPWARYILRRCPTWYAVERYAQQIIDALHRLGDGRTCPDCGTPILWQSVARPGQTGDPQYGCCDCESRVWLREAQDSSTLRRLETIFRDT